MKKKVFRIDGVDCAHCASKLQEEIEKIKGIKNVVYNFMAKKLSYEVEDGINLEEKIEEVMRLIKIKEPEAVVLEESIDVKNRKTVIFTKNIEEEIKVKIIKRILAITGVINAEFFGKGNSLTVEIERGAEIKEIYYQIEIELNAILKLSKIKFKHNFPIKSSNKNSFKLMIYAFGIIIYGVSHFINVKEIQFITFLVSYILIGGDVVYKALKKIKSRDIFDENFLMTLATFGAFIIGEYSEAVGVMLFYKIGEFFQDKAVDKSKESITSLIKMKRDKVTIIKDDRTTIECSSEMIKKGDKILVKPGELIPIDGTVILGESEADTSNITGEFIPLLIKRGTLVIGGYINKTGVIEIYADKDYKNSTIAKILELVETSIERKSKTENFITKFAKIYTPSVVAAALLTIIIPIIFGGKAEVWIYRALTFLVVSCPCALVISIPLSYFVGIGKAAKEGILIKGSNYLEAMALVTGVVFDKTGTITKGKLTIANIEFEGIDENEFKKIVCYGEYFSNHPIAKAILEQLKINIDSTHIVSYKEISGKGAIVNTKSENIIIGSKKFLEENGINVIEKSSENTSVYVSKNNIYVGKIEISDEIKEDSVNAVKMLKKNNIKTVILTGDKKESAKKIGDVVGIDELYSELLPDEKVVMYENIAKNNIKTIFVGDGVNDAPVIARADIGIAMGGAGSDAAIEVADVVIISDEISKVYEGIKIAEKTRKIVIQNIVFAIGIKIGVIILAFFGIINMWIGVFADVGVALIAIFNALRIAGDNKKS